MKISIITICFNSEATIEDTIKSVLSQSFKNIEYIIIDGASSDNTLTIVNNYKDKIAKIVTERDMGIYDAMNKGIVLATGDVIGILNSDDIYHDQNVIKDVMEYFIEDSELEILYGNLVYVKENDTQNIVRKWKSSEYHQRFFENGNVPPHPALFSKNSVYHRAGLFNLKYKLAADYEFMFRIFKKFHFKSKHIERLMVKMRLGGATNNSMKNIIKGNLEILNSWKMNGVNPPIMLMPRRIVKRLMQFI